MSLTHPNSAYPIKIAAFIAAFFTARRLGRVPFGETLICHQCRDVWGDPRLPTAAKESGSRTEFDTYDASNDATRITAQGPRPPFRWPNWVDGVSGGAAQRTRFLRLGLGLGLAQRLHIPHIICHPASYEEIFPFRSGGNVRDCLPDCGIAPSGRRRGGSKAAS